jgi:hypothetical protein
MGLSEALARPFVVSTQTDNPLNADSSSEPAASQNKVADFVTQQTFVSLTVSTAIVKAAWQGLKQLDKWFNSLWVPFALCAAFGALQFLVALINLADKKKGLHIALAAGIASLNVLVLWSAVAGSGEAADKIGVDIGT